MSYCCCWPECRSWLYYCNYLIKGTIFRNIKYVILSSIYILQKKSNFKKNQEDIILKIHSHSVVYGQRAGLQYPSSRVQTLPKPSDFQDEKNSQHAFHWRGSKAVGLMSQISGMLKIRKFKWKSEFRQNYRTISSPQFHMSLLESLTSLRTYRHLSAKVGKSKGGGKQLQTTPKDLSRIQVCQSHTGHMIGLWILQAHPLRLHTNELTNSRKVPVIFVRL